MAAPALATGTKQQTRYQQESSNAQDPGLPVPQEVFFSIFAFIHLIVLAGALRRKPETASSQRIADTNRWRFNAASHGAG